VSTRTVTSQAELDAALADNAALIYIESPADVWLTLTETGSSRVVACGYSRVVAWDYSRVDARGHSRVVARGRVVAWDSSRVSARGSSRVVARGYSRVDACDYSRVDACDYSRVDARGHSRVVARGHSNVVACDSSRVKAGKYVAVHLHSQRVTLTGGVVIDMTAVDRSDPVRWAELYGAKITRGRMTVYKGVDAELRSAHNAFKYPIGKTVTAPDWDPTGECGNGLHFSPSPIGTEAYCEPARYLECTVAVKDLVVLGDKIKARSCRVVREVDRWGDPVGGVAS
jgi:hypothetical protein